MFQCKTRAHVFDSTDVERLLRDCRGLSTCDLLPINFDVDLVNDEFEEEKAGIESCPHDYREEGNEFSALDFEWECELCTFVNWPDAVVCEMCGEWNWKIHLEDETTILSAKETLNGNCIGLISLSNSASNKSKPISVSIVTLDYLTPVRKRASKAEKLQEQIEKEERRARRRTRIGNRKPKKRHDQYPPEILRELPDPTSLAQMRGRPVSVKLLPVPKRLKESVKEVQEVLRNKSDAKQLNGLAFHGTDEKNTSNIIEKGLLIGGSETVRRNGAAYGEGVYCAKNIGTAEMYARGTSSPIFACLVREKVKDCGSILVVPQSTYIFPVYLLSLGSCGCMPIAMDHNIRIVNARKVRHLAASPQEDSESSSPQGISYDAVFQLAGRFNGRINMCDPTRKARRTWLCS